VESAAGGALSAASTPAPIRLNVVHSAIAGSQALLNVIQEAGLFGKHGLEIELANVGGRTATQALLAGEVPLIVTSGIEVVASGLAGGDAVIVAAGVNTLDTSIWTRGVMEPAGLRGRRIGISQLGDSTDFAARYAARRWGLDPASDIEILQTGQPGERLAALESGGVDATILQPPLTVRASKAGLRKLAEMADLGLEYQHTVVLSTRRRIAEDPESVERFVRAWSEGLYYYQAHPEQAQAAVGRFMRLEDAEALAETYAHYRRLYARPPYPTLPGLQTILDILAQDDPRARGPRPEDFVDVRFLDRLSAAGQFRAWEQQYPPAP
jgi:NitT/TauT family transport system substrate-binding protein